jgi:hypothetical protein
MKLSTPATIATAISKPRLVPPMTQFVFRPLPDVDFQLLNMEQKLAYLHEAFKVLMARDTMHGVDSLDILEQAPASDPPLQ